MMFFNFIRELKGYSNLLCLPFQFIKIHPQKIYKKSTTGVVESKFLYMENNQISFELLPSAVSKILNDISEIKKILMRNRPREPDGKEVLSFKNALKFLSQNGYEISGSTLYKLTSAKRVPFSKINNRLVFFKKDLILWINSQIVESKKNENESVIKSAILPSNKKTKNASK